METNSKFGSWVNDKIMPPVMKFVNTKAVKALQDGMIYSLPFIIVGSIFLIFANCKNKLATPWHDTVR